MFRILGIAYILILMLTLIFDFAKIRTDKGGGDQNAD